MSDKELIECYKNIIEAQRTTINILTGLFDDLNKKIEEMVKDVG